MVEEIAGALLGRRNADGGWGSETGLPSNTETTALALLALRSAGAADEAAGAAGWLRARQREDGSWPATEDTPGGSWMTSVAVLALARTGEDVERAARGGRWLLGVEGTTGSRFWRFLAWVFRQKPVNELDPDLKGWPWVDGAFGWVEPTAHALLALGAAGSGLPASSLRARIEDGERMILDRACPGGGWNYGNSRVLDTDLRPYADTTAWALLALRGAGEHAKVRLGLDVLARLAAGTRSGLSLALAVLALEAHGRDAAALRARLVDTYRGTGFLGLSRPAALALLALTDGSHQFRTP